ncbi:MAG TPA: hypothetical protein VOA88_18450 [Candidatus Dormibacteraeota bacterium]|nr:hypothetical protein [Candidatus Dormibacteraeota bacterium]
MSDAPHYRTEEEIEDVVRRFETCSYTPAEFVGKLVAELREGQGGLVPLVNSVVERCSDKNLIYESYSRERIASAEAKAKWIEPDVKSQC